MGDAWTTIRLNFSVTTEKISNFAAENKNWIMIDRTIANSIEKDFDRGKIIVITGARQVGKTTLLESFASRFTKVLNLNCDNYDDSHPWSGLRLWRSPQIT